MITDEKEWLQNNKVTAAVVIDALWITDNKNPQILAHGVSPPCWKNSQLFHFKLTM